MKTDAKIVPVSTSMREDEVDALDELNVASLRDANWPQGSRNSRAGGARAMLRFALAHEAQFRQWMIETNGQVVE